MAQERIRQPGYDRGMLVERGVTTVARDLSAQSAVRDAG